ncbi:MAG: TRIC cation channel family protein [Kineosporiaceae bacterium]
MPPLPDLATHTPLWLALLTVAVNALVGALHGMDGSHRWDIVGVSVFALLMGLGGGFIRDLLLGDLPAQSLRSPWFLLTVLAAVLLALVVGDAVRRLRVVMAVLDTVAMGLFAATGTAAALAHALPVTSAALVGTVSAVGGGMLVSIVRDEVPEVVLASAPNALLAAFTSLVYAAARPLTPTTASLLALGSLLVARYLTWRFRVQTRPAAPLRRRPPSG